MKLRITYTQDFDSVFKNHPYPWKLRTVDYPTAEHTARYVYDAKGRHITTVFSQTSLLWELYKYITTGILPTPVIAWAAWHQRFPLPWRSVATHYRTHGDQRIVAANNTSIYCYYSENMEQNNAARLLLTLARIAAAKQQGQLIQLS